MKSWVLRAAFALGCSGCGCATPPDPQAITVQLVDGLTGSPICTGTVIVHEGTFTQTLSPPFVADAGYGDGGVIGCVFTAVNARPGSYTVDVTSDGYLPATLTNVQVVMNGCRLESQSRIVPLTPTM